MLQRLRNRVFLIISIIPLVFGCAHPETGNEIDRNTSPIVPVLAKEFTGKVVDTNGSAISGADISIGSTTVTSDDKGWFHATSDDGLPKWVAVNKTGFISRTRAAEPGVPVLIRLSPEDGKTIVLSFAGDVMLGRRFYDPNEDGDISDGLLPPNANIEAHLRLLAPIRPVIGMADLTAVNLESPLSDQPFFSTRDPRPTTYHSTKDYVFASNSNLAEALYESGIDVVDLGNNHLYDLLESGIQSTISALDKTNLFHFGAGINEETAWAPAIVNVKGQKVAFIGCTTIWHPIPAVTDQDISYVASDALNKGGAAFCDEAKLRTAVVQARQNSDMVVVMIHGGYEYVRTPSENVAQLSAAAKEAGAILVINHHPHVVGGISWDGQTATAWSMGNFIFDQTVWPTFESYMLTVYVRDGKIVRAYVDPLMIKDYIPHGVTGSLADYVIRGAAGRVPGPFILESGTMEIDIDHNAIEKTYTQSFENVPDPGEIVAVPQAQWVSGFQGSGKLILGRDLLWIGGFEEDDVDLAGYGAPLWDHTTGNIQIGSEYAFTGNAGIRLTRVASNESDAVTSHLHRVLVDAGTKLSVTGMVRASSNAFPLVQLSWFPDTLGGSSSKTIEPILIQHSDQWQPFRLDVLVPEDAVALNVFLRLPPPTQGVVTSDFDDIRIIEWAPDHTPFSPLYNFELLTGSGILTFTQQVLPGAEEWFTIP